MDAMEPLLHSRLSYRVAQKFVLEANFLIQPFSSRRYPECPKSSTTKCSSDVEQRINACVSQSGRRS